MNECKSSVGGNNGEAFFVCFTCMCSNTLFPKFGNQPSRLYYTHT